MSRQYMLGKWCVRCGRTTPTPYTLKAIQWRRKANLPIRSVLDLGCGNGRNLRAFQIGTCAKRLVGFDMCTDKAKGLCIDHMCRTVRLVNGTLGRTEPPKGKFDIVLLNYSLMFLTSDEARALARQVAPRMADGGHVIVEMYPAKDSECSSESKCETRIWQVAVEIMSACKADIFRRSKNRMIIRRIQSETVLDL